MSRQWILHAAFVACMTLVFLSEAKGADETRTTTNRFVGIRTVFHHAPAIDVESGITVPIERAVSDVPGVRMVTSTSREGESFVRVSLSPGQSFDDVARAVAEAVRNVVDELPAGAQTPAITSATRAAWPGIWLTIEADEHTTLDAAVRHIRRRIERIPHVVEARVIGHRRRELQVRCDPQRLAAFGISFDRCLKVVERIAKDSPLTLEHLRGSELIMKDDVPVRLRDVAMLEFGFGPPRGLAWVDGRPTVAIGVFVPAGAAAAALEQVRAALPELERTLPKDASLTLKTDVTRDAEGGLLVEFLVPPSHASMEVSRRIAADFERGIRSLSANGILSVCEHDDAAIRLHVHAKEGVTIEDLLHAARRQGRPGVQTRIAKVPPGPSTWQPRRDVELELMGPDRDRLAKWSKELARRLVGAGYREVVIAPPSATARIVVKLNRVKASKLGVNHQSIERTMRASRSGVPIAANGVDTPPVRVFLGDGEKAHDLGALDIPTGDALVPLNELADLSLVPAFMQLTRRKMRPAVRVTATFPLAGNVTLRNTIRLAEEIARELPLAEDYVVESR